MAPPLQGAQGSPGFDLDRMLGQSDPTVETSDANDPAYQAELQEAYNNASTNASYARQEGEAAQTAELGAENGVTSYEATQKGKLLNDIAAANENLQSKLRGHQRKVDMYLQEFAQYAADAIEAGAKMVREGMFNVAQAAVTMSQLGQGYDVNPAQMQASKMDVSISSAPSDYALRTEEADLTTEQETIDGMYAQVDRMEESIGEYYRTTLQEAQDRSQTARADYATKQKEKDDLWAQIQANREKPTV